MRRVHIWDCHCAWLLQRLERLSALTHCVPTERWALSPLTLIQKGYSQIFRYNQTHFFIHVTNILFDFFSPKGFQSPFPRIYSDGFLLPLDNENYFECCPFAVNFSFGFSCTRPTCFWLLQITGEDVLVINDKE